MKRRFLLGAAIAAAACALATPSATADGGREASDDEAAVREVIRLWYQAMRERDDGTILSVLGPAAILDDDLWRCSNPVSRSCSLVFVPQSLAFAALRFSHEIREIEVESRLARVAVLVRAWFPSQSGDYQRAAWAIFFLRKNGEGRWLIAVESETTIAVPD